MSSGPSAAAGANGPPGDMTQDYESLQVIGKGSFGTVYKATRKADRAQVVVKEVIITSLNEAERRCALQEASTLSKLQHENIIQYHETRSAEGKLFIVMEFAAGGDLSTAIKRRAQQQKCYTEDQIMLLFVQICLALWHVHSQNFMHRDLKSQNIFLCDNNVAKLGDFGIARSFKHTQDMASTAVGTPYYLSPEICEDKPYNSMSDVWGLGCILYEMATLKRAFEGNSLPALVTKILRGRFSPIPSRYSVHLRSLIHSMLARNPNRRPTVEAILNLPWMRRHLDRYAAHMHQISRQPAAFPSEGTSPETARAASTKHVSMLRSQPSNASRARMASVSLDRATASSQQRRVQAQVRDLPVPSKRSSRSSHHSLHRQLVPRLQCKQSEAMARYHPQSGRGASASPIPSSQTPPQTARNNKPERPPWQAPTARVKHRTADSLSANRIKLLDRSPAVGTRAARVSVDRRTQPYRQREDSAEPSCRRPVRAFTQPTAGPSRWPRQPSSVGPARRPAVKDTKPATVSKIQSLDRFQPNPVRNGQANTYAKPDVSRQVKRPVYIHPKPTSSSPPHKQDRAGAKEHELRQQSSTIPAGKAAEQPPEEDDDLHSLSSLSSISSYPVLAEPVPGDLGPVASSFWVPPPMMGPPSRPSSISRESALLPPVPALVCSQMEQPAHAGRWQSPTPEPVRRSKVAPQLECLAEDSKNQGEHATGKQDGDMHEQCKKPRTAHAQARDARKAESSASGHRLVSTSWLAGNFAALDAMQDNLCTATVPSSMADAAAAPDSAIQQQTDADTTASTSNIVSHAICPEAHHLASTDSDSDGRAPDIKAVPSLNLISQEPSETGNRQTSDCDMREAGPPVVTSPRACGRGSRDNQQMHCDDGFDDIMLPQGPSQSALQQQQPQKAKCPSPRKPAPRASFITTPVRRTSSLARRPQRQTQEQQVPTNYRSKSRPMNPQQRAAARQQAQELQQAHRSALQRIQPRLCREELKRAGKDFAARVREVKQADSSSSTREVHQSPRPQNEAFVIPLTPRSHHQNKQFADAAKAEGSERSKRRSPAVERPHRRLWVAPRHDGDDSALEMSSDWKGASASAWSGVGSPIQVSRVEEGQKPWRQNSNVRGSPRNLREPVVEIYVPASIARLGCTEEQLDAQVPSGGAQSELQSPELAEITPDTQGSELVVHAKLSSSGGVGADLLSEPTETSYHRYSTHNTPSEIFDSAKQDACRLQSDENEVMSGHEHDEMHAQHEVREYDPGSCVHEVPRDGWNPSSNSSAPRATQGSHSAGPVNKISELRARLQDRLGPERFQAAYCVVRKHQCEKTYDGHAERAAQAELDALLSPDTHLAYSMYRLLTLEEMMNGN